MDAAVAEDGEFLAQVDFRDLDVREEAGFLGAVEDVGQRGEDGVVIVGVVAELGDGLGDQHVEPVEGFGLVRVHVVVGFGEDRGGREAGRRTQHPRAGALSPWLLGGGGSGEDGGGADMLLVILLAGEGAAGRGGFGGGDLAENEEFDEGADEDHDGELPEQKPLCEWQASQVVRLYSCCGNGTRHTRIAESVELASRHLLYRPPY